MLTSRLNKVRLCLHSKNRRKAILHFSERLKIKSPTPELFYTATASSTPAAAYALIHSTKKESSTRIHNCIPIAWQPFEESGNRIKNQELRFKISRCIVLDSSLQQIFHSE